MFDYARELEKKVPVSSIKVIDKNSFLFTDSKQELIDAERYILKELGFMVSKVADYSVHKHLFPYLKTLRCNNKLA